MIHFHSAQSLQSHLPALSEALRAFLTKSDPFEAPWIVVQNKETEAWLNTAIADGIGISGNLNFILPNQFVFKLYREVDQSLPEILPSDRIPLQWGFLKVMDAHKAELSASGLVIPDSIDAKIALANEVADVFDLYQIYRPEMLENWVQANQKEKGNWQVRLWQLLITEMNEVASGIPVRYQIPALLTQSMQNGGINLPDEVFVVGISHWNQSFNRLITQIAKQSEVHWFQQTPKISDNISAMASDWVHPQSAVKKALMDELKQHDVSFSVHQPNETMPSELNADRIQVHSCHNPKREVEVLYQQLLSLFDTDESLSAHEVLVMVPDLDEYMPHLESVFLHEHSPTKLPIQNSKQINSDGEDAFLKLLSFFAEGEKVSQFLDLISSSGIKEKFKITDDILIYVEQWFEKMHIHYGLTVHDSDYSIEKGIYQLFDGVLLKEQPFAVFDNHIPFPIPLKKEAIQFVTPLHAVFRGLTSIKQNIESEKAINEWMSDALRWCSQIFPENSSINKTLTKLQHQISLFNNQEKFGLDTFRVWLTEHLVSSDASATQPGTGIQISSYIPYRNIPFRVSAILGFNEGVFPRNPKRPTFDLIHQNPQPGDRITKADDQLLFLERMSSTSDFVHISYGGEGEQGSLVSPIVQQLMDGVDGLKVQKHSLHAFSEYGNSDALFYEDANTKLFDTIDKSGLDWKPISQKISISPEQQIEVSELISFFTNPSKYICTNSLGVYDVYDDELLNDRQLFKVDGLQKYIIRNEIESAFSTLSIEEMLSYLKKNGQLPKGSLAVNTLYAEYDKVKLMNAYITQNFPDVHRAVEINHVIGDFVIHGKISGLHNSTIVRSQLASVNGKHIVKIWLEFLVAQCFCGIKSAILIAFNNDKLVVHRFKSCDNPHEKLLEFLEYFSKSSFDEKDLCLLPDLCWELVCSDLEPDKTNKKLNEVWEGSRYRTGLMDDYYNRLIFGDVNPSTFPEFMTLSERLYDPIAMHWEEEEP
ncbi:MAG: exodeoxyribonuclease V subunit gamma [Balneolaceae bacterium]|nr:exodeoxyribonuclease V subunit gamma [Balneolaceae bacterium]